MDTYIYIYICASVGLSGGTCEHLSFYPHICLHAMSACPSYATEAYTPLPINVYSV